MKEGRAGENLICPCGKEFWARAADVRRGRQFCSKACRYRHMPPRPEPMIPAVKRCTRCGAEKRSSEFASDRRASNGLQSQCRDCQKRAHRDRYKADPQYREHIKARSRTHRAANVQRARATGASWKVANPEKVRQYGRRGTLRRFGMTEKCYDELLSLQGGHCALCLATTYNGRAKFLGIDHDHECCNIEVGYCCGDCVRGLLCRNCNREVERVANGERQGAADVVEYLAYPPYVQLRERNAA